MNAALPGRTFPFTRDRRSSRNHHLQRAMQTHRHKRSAWSPSWTPQQTEALRKGSCRWIAYGLGVDSPIWPHCLWLLGMLAIKGVLEESQTGKVALCDRCQERSRPSRQEKAMSATCDTPRPRFEAASTARSDVCLIKQPCETTINHQHINSDTNELIHVQKSKTTILSLPPELNHLIAGYLDYPDLLSLKISHPYLTSTFSTLPIVTQRVSWVLRRNAQDLPIPRALQLSFRSDKAFVANREVNDILRRRRLHIECLKCEGARDFVVDNFGPKGKTMCFVTGGVCPSIINRERLKGKFISTLTRGLGFGQCVQGPNGRGIKLGGAPTTRSRSVGRSVAVEIATVFGVIVLVFAVMLSYLICIR
ncbi:hypothetical protein PV11_07916 [Exophiala sideris]|uniref:F-box domain-containing protein n=1 Tax=Exophiala sideris TaxID=1016849 RepID=A0A0D1WZ33_9EURO|nr:hypothetical protein PV11_07916 [Exophiala sideris]